VGHDRPELARVLNRPQLLALGVGAIIGSGIFVVPGPAAAQFAGPAIVFSFLISGFACALAGLCYAELAGMFPSAGSAYAYAYQAFGPLTGWLVGWLLLLEYIFAAAILGIGWSGYMTSLLADAGLHLPSALIHSPISIDSVGDTHIGAGIIDLPAVIILAIACFVARREVKLSATVNAVITCMKVGIIILVIAAGFRYVNVANWHPFVPPNSGRWGEFGFSGIMRGAAVTFYVYLGFDTVSVAAQEARNPQRDIPFGIIGSLMIVTGLFIPMSLILTGLTSYTTLNVAQPVSVALAAVSPHLRWLRPIVDVGAMIGMFSVMMIVLMAQSRILYAMALDGMVPAIFCNLHPRYRTPAIGTVVGASLAALVAASLSITLLSQMVSIGALFAFTTVAAGVLVLRVRHPQLPRSFRVAWVPAIPLAAIAVCAYLMVSLPVGTWMRLCVWVFCGLLIYSVYGRRVERKGAIY